MATDGLTQRIGDLRHAIADEQEHGDPNPISLSAALDALEMEQQAGQE